MLTISYRKRDYRAVLSWGDCEPGSGWVEIIKRLAVDKASETSQEAANRLSIPWSAFVGLRDQLLDVFTAYDMRLGVELHVDDEAIRLLRKSRRAIDEYTSASTAPSTTEEKVKHKLNEVGFLKTLSAEQMRNVRQIASLSAAAIFSVNSAGKTTEALAYFFYRARKNEHLLIVAPKGVFPEWQSELRECLQTPAVSLVRLEGPQSEIEHLLNPSPRCMLITYQQLSRQARTIAAYATRHRMYILLDESHRLSTVLREQERRSILEIAHLAVGKLIISGTPMPQAVDDLIPQFAFLYPEIPADPETVIGLVRPIYVRTNKTELGLPPVTRMLVQFPMAPMQNELYKLMKFEVSREAASALSTRSKQVFRTLGRSVAHLLQFVSNPALLSSHINFAHPDLLAAALAEGDGPKLKYVLRRVRELARQNKKVLVWSSFVRNVEFISQRLADMGAVFIHGGVDAGDEDDDESREGKIKLFHDDPNIRVMVANPAAASEGVSLHKVCHHAIYLDRTFNAAHYLQSEDRIHRFGLPPCQDATIEIVECLGSVDETVRERLNYKIGKMAEALEDSSLRPDPIPLDPVDIEDYDEYSTGLTPEDIQALLNAFSAGQK